MLLVASQKWGFYSTATDALEPEILAGAVQAAFLQGA